MEGWSANGPRRVIGLHGTQLMICKQYKCHNSKCSRFERMFRGWNPKCIARLPKGIQEDFQWRISHKTAISPEVVTIMELPNISAAQKARIISEYHTNRYYRQMRRYVFARLAQLYKHTPSQAELDHAAKNGSFVEEFPQFGSAGYPSRIPTAPFIDQVYTQYAEEREDFCTRRLQMVHGKHYQGDHSHKVNAKIMLGGERPFGATWSVLTEFKQCAAYRVTESKGHDEVREVEEGLEERHELLGLPPMETYTVDNGPEMEDLLVDCHPSLRVDKAVPRSAGTMRFDSGIGKTIKCVKTQAAAISVISMLRQLLGTDKVLGFDLEWNVTKQKNAPQAKVATIQLCTKDFCAIFQLHQLKEIPPKLKELLEDESITKVGLHINGDRDKLLKDWSVHLANAIELSSLANAKLGHNKSWGLQKLCELVLGKILKKPNHIRVSQNWTNYELSPEQEEYAAADAYAGLLVHQRLLETADFLASFNSPTLLSKLQQGDIDKMKVAELKGALESLMMNKNGNKSELHTRLSTAVEFLRGKSGTRADVPVFTWHKVSVPGQCIRDVAEEQSVDLFQLIRLNKPRMRRLSKASSLQAGTMLLLPARVNDGNLSVEHELSLLGGAADLEPGIAFLAHLVY